MNVRKGEGGVVKCEGERSGREDEGSAPSRNMSSCVLRTALAKKVTKQEG